MMIRDESLTIQKFTAERERERERGKERVSEDVKTRARQ